jgi:DNA-binding CsgD family transcriptional regulator
VRAQQWDVSDIVEEIQCPVLLIQRRDLTYPTLEEAMSLCQRLRDAELVVLAGASFGLSDDEDAIPVMMEFVRQGPNRSSPTAAPVSHGLLSDRERQVLALLAAGSSGKEIAGELSVSVSTVNRHVANVYTKIGAHNRAEATLWAARHGLV